WMKRSGKRSAKKLTMVDSVRSPTSTTMRGSCSPRSTSARPKPSRVFFISVFSGSVMVAVVMRSSLARKGGSGSRGTSSGQEPRRPLGVGGAELLQRLLRLVGLGGLAVPAVVVRHVRDSLAHHGVSHDQAPRALVSADIREAAQDARHVVPVVPYPVPVDRPPLVGERLDPHRVLHVAVDLLAVVVDDPAQIVELVVGGEHGSFPDLALLLLAV